MLSTDKLNNALIELSKKVPNYQNEAKQIANAVASLLEAGGDINVKDSNGKGLLRHAVNVNTKIASGYVLALLLERGIDVNQDGIYP